MPRAIDFHVHLPTTEFMRVTLGPYGQAAEKFFRTEIKLKDIEQIAADYAEKDFDTFDYFKPEVREKILWGNAQKLLTHTSVKDMSFSSQ